MEFFLNLLSESLGKVWGSFTHNWIFLLISVLISVWLKLSVRPEKISELLVRYRKVGVLGATVAAVTTPFCSCGTTAVILGMIASTIPWAPIVAFMVASPLTSPEELIYSAGIFGWPFAIAFFVSSILLGLLGGALAEFCEARGWLANQARFSSQPVGSTASAKKSQPAAAQANSGCTCEPSRAPVSGIVWELAPAAAVATPSTCACGAPTAPAPRAAEKCACSPASPSPSQVVEKPAPENVPSGVTRQQWLNELYQTGAKLLVMFLGFAFLGYLLNGLIPPAWISAIFGKGNIYSVPLAATLGLPFYINTEGSLPLVRALIDGGMSQGAALAFLITGAGTSIGAVGGALTIARWRVIALVIATLWVGAIILGYAYDLLLAIRLF